VSANQIGDIVAYVALSILMLWFLALAWSVWRHR
jgi:hypothetical protein